MFFCKENKIKTTYICWTQWAAVSTHSLLIREPPHKTNEILEIKAKKYKVVKENELIIHLPLETNACHGKLWGVDSKPPIILEIESELLGATVEFPQ